MDSDFQIFILASRTNISLVYPGVNNIQKNVELCKFGSKIMGYLVYIMR